MLEKKELVPVVDDVLKALPDVLRIQYSAFALPQNARDFLQNRWHASSNRNELGDNGVCRHLVYADQETLSQFARFSVGHRTKMKRLEVREVTTRRPDRVQDMVESDGTGDDPSHPHAPLPE